MPFFSFLPFVCFLSFLSPCLSLALFSFFHALFVYPSDFSSVGWQLILFTRDVMISIWVVLPNARISVWPSKSELQIRLLCACFWYTWWAHFWYSVITDAFWFHVLLHARLCTCMSVCSYVCVKHKVTHSHKHIKWV